jgi:hypothetical protein
MSTRSGSTRSAIYCHHPFCPKQHKAFATEAAFTTHLVTMPHCFAYLVSNNAGNHCQLSAGQAIARTVDPLSRTRIVRPNKRPCVLRRHVVNALPPEPRLPVQHVSHAPVVAPYDVPDLSDVVCDGSVDQHDSDCFDALPNTCVPPEHQFVYSTDQKWTVALLKLLDNMNAPDYAFGAILCWARSANADNYSFYPVGGLSRNKNVDVLFASVPNADQLLPSVQTVQCPHGPTMDVITFDFVPQLLSLLQNPSIMTQENLVIAVDNPLQRYQSPNNVLGEAISGRVYGEAYDRYITNPRRQLFVPIIQWIDRTSVTGNDRFSLKPYMFTPAIFTEKFRRTIRAWGYHGFLPKAKQSSAQNQTKRQGDNVRNYHAQLRTVLSTFATANKRLRNVVVPLGPTKTLCVDIVTCLLFVIQDMQEGDMLCGRFGPHTSLIRRHSRACNIDYDNLDNYNVHCTYVHATDMHEIALCPDDKRRQQWSQHRVDNAFNSVLLADPIRGIFGSTPVETMHCFRKGMIEVVTFLVLENVPTSKKAALDGLAIRFHHTHRQTYRKAYPATDFSNGITNLTKISASERLGLVFLFVILANYDEGWRILDSALQSRTCTKLASVVQLFEAMLCFDAWLNQESYWQLADTAEAKTSFLLSLRKLMSWCCKRLPTTNSERWNLPKFHELLHIVDDMIRFGAPTNFCAQRPESLLIAAAKQPGRRAQKRHNGSSYELQAAQRVAYSCMIHTVYSRIWDTEPYVPDVVDTSDLIAEGTGHATFCQVQRIPLTTTPPSYSYRVCWHTTTDIALMTLPGALLTFLCSHFGHSVRICTEYKRDIHTFRCHPCYQSNGPIYDWLLVNFEGFITPFPCRLAAVVIMPSPNVGDGGQMTKPPSYKLVVQSTTTKTHVNSVLFTEWNWDPQYLVIEPETIVGPCFVITIAADNSRVLEALPLSKWPGQFTNIYNITC